MSVWVWKNKATTCLQGTLHENIWLKGDSQFVVLYSARILIFYAQLFETNDVVS